jgi:hypothetical protein
VCPGNTWTIVEVCSENTFATVRSLGIKNVGYQKGSGNQKLGHKAFIRTPEKYSSNFKEHACVISSVFSETFANYETFCQMCIQIQNLNIKIPRQKKNVKIYSVH